MLLLIIPFIGFGQGWEKVISPGGGDKEGNSVQQTVDGGYIVCGYWNNQTGNSSDLCLIKTDDKGDTLWTKVYGGVNSERGYSVQQTIDGGYIACGGTMDVFLVKTDGNGVEQWNQTFGGTGTDIGNSVKQTSDGGYIITGETEDVFIPGVNGENNIYLIKTDGNGNVTSTFNIPNPSSNKKLEKIFDMLGRETKAPKNTPFIEIYDDGSTEKKIVID